MSHPSSSEVAKLLSGDETEDANDEPNEEDTGDKCGLDFLLFGVKSSFALGRFFDEIGDINSGDDGGVAQGEGRDVGLGVDLSLESKLD